MNRRRVFQLLTGACASLGFAPKVKASAKPNDVVIGDRTHQGTFFELNGVSFWLGHEMGLWRLEDYDTGKYALVVKPESWQLDWQEIKGKDGAPFRHGICYRNTRTGEYEGYVLVKGQIVGCKVTGETDTHVIGIRRNGDQRLFEK